MAVSILNQLLGGLAGYGTGRAQQLQLNQAGDDRIRKQRDDDFTKSLQLSQAGYAPDATGSSSAINVPFSGGDQKFAFNYDQSPQGQVQKKQQAIDAAKESAAAAAKDKTNQQAFGTLRRVLQDHPLSQGEYDSGVDYGDALKSGLSSRNAIALENSKQHAPLMGSPEWQDAERFKASLRPEPQPQILTANDPEGGPHFYRVPKAGGAPEEIQGIAPTAKGGQGDVNTARIAVGASQATDADKIATAFEDQVLAKKRGIGTMAAALAKVAMSGDPVKSAAAEGTLNKIDPELANYVRAQKTIATAERMITPRGGSNAMMSAEALLSGAGPNAGEAQITQARNYRKALIGGLQTHQTAGGRGGHPAGPPPNAPGTETVGGAPGHVNLGGTTSTISPAERAALKAQGFTDAQLTAKYGPP